MALSSSRSWFFSWAQTVDHLTDSMLQIRPTKHEENKAFYSNKTEIEQLIKEKHVTGLTIKMLRWRLKCFLPFFYGKETEAKFHYLFRFLVWTGLNHSQLWHVRVWRYSLSLLLSTNLMKRGKKNKVSHCCAGLTGLKYSLELVWIHPQLKIVPNKCATSS